MYSSAYDATQVEALTTHEQAQVSTLAHKPLSVVPTALAVLFFYGSLAPLFLLLVFMYTSSMASTYHALSLTVLSKLCHEAVVIYTTYVFTRR